MTKHSFEAEALRYVLDEMDASQRAAFADQLTRYPAARIALEECADALTVVRRQPAELPVFAGFLETELNRVFGTPRVSVPHRLKRRVYQLREFIALS